MDPIVLHSGGLFPPSCGPVRTHCGKLVPFDRFHVRILGEDEPEGATDCPECEAYHLKRWGKQEPTNKEKP